MSTGFVRWILLAVLLAVASLTPEGAMAKAMVSGVRAGDHGDTTRFVLDLDQEITFRVFTLANPYRVVVDLPDLEWAAAGLSQPVGFIKGYRHGLFKPGNARIVLDLARPAAVKEAFVIPPQGAGVWRFVLDLQPVSQALFMQKQGVPGDAAWQSAALTMPAAPPKTRPINAKPVVVIDAGHGGVDPGAIGVSGVYEKQLTLQMARQLRKELEKSRTFKVVLTRDSDIFIPLRERIAIARAANADLFISLHADSVPDRQTRGVSVYTLSEKSSDAEAAALADRENKADLIGGMDLTQESAEVTSILIDLAQRETMNLSASFAADVVSALKPRTKLLPNTHRFAGFAVLKAPDVPSVLIELGFLTNPQDERLLRDPEHRARVAHDLGRAIERYFQRQNKLARP